MRIVFMGTPDFAAVSLKKLLDRGDDIPGVFTQPDRYRGRGKGVDASPVKVLATESGIPVYQPEKLRDGTALELLRSLRPEIVVVVAYGRILPDTLLAVPPLGCVNVHGSLLPKYRGSAPIQWAVLNGDKTTGVSTMYLASEMDSGDIIYQAETEIGEFETSGELFDRLAALGAETLDRTLRDIQAGTAPRIPQDHAAASYTVQLDKSMSPIDWDRPPREIVKRIYGLQPWPVATAEIDGAALRVFGAEYSDFTTDKAPGTVVSAGKRGITVACAGGQTLTLTEVQAPGKKRVRAADWLLGHPLQVD